MHGFFRVLTMVLAAPAGLLGSASWSPTLAYPEMCFDYCDGQPESCLVLCFGGMGPGGCGNCHWARAEPSGWEGGSSSVGDQSVAPALLYAAELSD